MVETGDDRAGGASCAAVFEPMEFCVVVGLCEGSKHEIVGVLEVGLGIGGGVWRRTGLVVGVVGWRGRNGGCDVGRRRWGGIDDAELDDGRRIDRPAVGFCGDVFSGCSANGSRGDATFAADAAHTGLLGLLADDEVVYSGGRDEHGQGGGAGD